MLRLNAQGQLRPPGGYHWVLFTTRVPAGGRRWQGQGTAFTGKGTPLDCTRLGGWAAGHQAPWLVLADLPPQAAQGGWYGLRAWRKHGFTRLQSGGWQWHDTRMDDPIRAERWGLAMALATGWLLSVGGEAEAARPAAPLPPVPGAGPPPRAGWTLGR